MNYGPGMDGFAYQADTYCVDCGEIIVRHLQTNNGVDTGDTDDYPQPIFFGEHDREVCCADCGEYMYGEIDLEELAYRDRYDPSTDSLYRAAMKDAGRSNQLE